MLVIRHPPYPRLNLFSFIRINEVFPLDSFRPEVGVEVASQPQPFGLADLIQSEDHLELVLYRFHKLLLTGDLSDFLIELVLHSLRDFP